MYSTLYTIPPKFVSQLHTVTAYSPLNQNYTGLPSETFNQNTVSVSLLREQHV